MYPSIRTHELEELLKYKKINLIDIRDSYQYNRGHIKGSKNIPMYKLMIDEKKYLNKDSKYYLICQTGQKSAILCNFLNALGYQVINVEDGIVNWTKGLEK